MGSIFGCCEARSGEGKYNTAISLKDKDIQKQEKKKHRILLLGPGDSGKTTLLNQIRKLHGSIRTDNSLDTIRDLIKINIVKYMAVLTAKSNELGIKLKPESYPLAKNVLEYSISMFRGNIDLNQGYAPRPGAHSNRIDPTTLHPFRSHPDPSQQSQQPQQSPQAQQSNTPNTANPTNSANSANGVNTASAGDSSNNNNNLTNAGTAGGPHLRTVGSVSSSDPSASSEAGPSMILETKLSEAENARQNHSKHTNLESMAQLNRDAQVPDSIVTAIKTLWNDPGIKDCLEKRSNYQIDDNVSYFFDSIDRVFDENFEPSDDDILRLRMRTSGFGEQAFEVYFDEKQLTSTGTDDNGVLRRIKCDEQITEDQQKKMEKFVFIDVGGQRSERKKWMRVMMDDSSIQAVLYLVAISEFDLMCFEDHTTRRLDEALELFEECAKKGILDDKTVSIFFNKYDLFTEKVANKSISFSNYYPEFDGDNRNEKHIINFVAKKFKRVYYKESRGYQQNEHILTEADIQLKLANKSNVHQMNTNINIDMEDNNNNGKDASESNKTKISMYKNGMNGMNANDLSAQKRADNETESNLGDAQRLHSVESTMESKGDDRPALTNDPSHTQTATNTNTNTQTNAHEDDGFGVVTGDWDLDTFFCHCTCALDTQQIEKIMKDIQIKLISKNFKQVGFM